MPRSRASSATNSRRAASQDLRVGSPLGSTGGGPASGPFKESLLDTATPITSNAGAIVSLSRRYHEISYRDFFALDSVSRRAGARADQQPEQPDLVEQVPVSGQ